MKYPCERRSMTRVSPRGVVERPDT